MTDPTKEHTISLSNQLDILVASMKPLSVMTPEWDAKVKQYLLLSLKMSRINESKKFL